jgi:hypothetical protein
MTRRSERHCGRHENSADPGQRDDQHNTQIGSDGTGVPASLIVAAGLEAQYASLTEPLTGATPTNLALGKPVQVQFLNGSPAELQPYSQLSYATDGNPSTYIQATGQFLWQLVVDLQADLHPGHRDRRHAAAALCHCLPRGCID